MKPTELLYLERMDLLSNEATVIDIVEDNGKMNVILDQTIFYPQGGGQPYDQGEIISPSGKFRVDEVRFTEGVVKHIGVFEEGKFSAGEKVSMHVSPERRLLNSRLHSAGHVVDMGVYALKPDWKPGKGYHFPDGPYVEYEGILNEEDREKLIRDLETKCNEYISNSIPVTERIVTYEELSNYCRHVPLHIPEGKPIRVITFGDFGVACGGTHVQNLSDLKSMTIRKIKGTGTIKVSYDIKR